MIKMKSKFKIFFAVLLSALFIFAVAACADPSTPQTPDNPSVPNTPSEPDTPEEPTTKSILLLFMWTAMKFTARPSIEIGPQLFPILPKKRVTDLTDGMTEKQK